MSYTVPTVSDFKRQFARDFPYAVPAWGAAATLTVVAGVVTAALVTAGGVGYKSKPTVTLVDPNGAGAVINPTVSGGKVTALAVTAGGTNYSANATAVFSGGAGDESDLDRVRDDDIAQAQADAQFNVNQALFDGQAAWARAFNYLTAHMLVEKLLAAGEGLSSQYNWLTTSKTVGDVSESFEIPERIKKDPMLSAFSKTRYGAMYLQIVSPLLIGNVSTAFRQSMP